MRFKKPLKTCGKSMFLEDIWRQRTFRRLAKCLFGGLLDGLKASRKQVECHVGFKIGFTGPSRAHDRQRWPQARARKGTTLIGKLSGGGSGLPGGSKILKNRRSEDPKLSNRSIEEIEKRSSRDLTRRWTVGPANFSGPPTTRPSRLSACNVRRGPLAH